MWNWSEIPVHHRTNHFCLFSLTLYSQKCLSEQTKMPLGMLAFVCELVSRKHFLSSVLKVTDSLVFYTLLRKGESLWPWLDLGHPVSFHLLSIPPAQYLSSSKKNWVKFISLTNFLIDFHLCWKLCPHIKECINQQNIPLTFHYKAIFISPLQL